MLFAQAGGRFGGGPANLDIPPEALGMVIVIALIILAIALTIEIFYLLTRDRCYSRISARPAARQFPPGHRV
jgi:hypothetical protein